MVCGSTKPRLYVISAPEDGMWPSEYVECSSYNATYTYGRWYTISCLLNNKENYDNAIVMFANCSGEGSIFWDDLGIYDLSVLGHTVTKKWADAQLQDLEQINGYITVEAY